ncbi:monomeric sarcosine oxidase [Carbonactinospora thermoautotrophica]|uniref:NAD(P)/FAD-dependent oxidoreductase n=1 Tax=Carbonactinospora thermoautotrophica TaxID=1469144 RepID=UPI00226DC05C|nr:FAD-binding oxidoreductase [Carbonactinospora thermoautotrophica]MCX9192305.1 monomeric sarcosine oxidase [Carbonactinospora thermoautotrophica]
MVPKHARYVIIGAGIHGLSTAWHLAKELRARNRGDGRDILVVDKAQIGAGASGIACGVIRNNYFQSAMRELMAHSVSVWESDPQAFAYYPVGYMQIAPESMHADVVQIYEEQRAIGYKSVLIEGEEDCRAYMLDLFSDWQAPGVTVILHEKRGGYANNIKSLQGLAGKTQAEGVRIATGVRVTGLRLDGGAVTAVETDQGTIQCDHLVVAVGPWIRDIWAMLELPDRISVTTPDGRIHPDRPMWTYWALQEGTIEVNPNEFMDNRGNFPPVLHVDSDAPLYDDVDGGLITDRMWGIYYKPDFFVGGVQGGTAPYVIDRPAEQVAVDPYGTKSPEFVVKDDFIRMWTSALAHCHKRFEGKRHLYRREPSGGIGAFTPDSFPVFDVFRQNAYVIADSNHGYKMLGVGALVAKELLGEPQALLEPFRFSRYATGKLHPTSNSPFPWS